MATVIIDRSRTGSPGRDQIIAERGLLHVVEEVGRQLAPRGTARSGAVRVAGHSWPWISLPGRAQVVVGRHRLSLSVGDAEQVDGADAAAADEVRERDARVRRPGGRSASPRSCCTHSWIMARPVGPPG